MERRQVLLVDAFADEPTGGRSVAVVPDDSLSHSHRAAIASELGTSGVVTYSDGELVYTDCDGSQAVVAGAVAGYAALSNRGLIAPSTHEFHTAGAVTPSDPFLVELTEDGRVTFEIPSQNPTEIAAESEEIAEAIGVDVATLEDVGADLPAAQVEAFGGTVLVPVNFLEHLSSATPDTCALASLLSSVGASRLFSFTFDTLEPHTDVHARIFDPSAAGNERPASGVGAAACGAHLFQGGAFDGDKDDVKIECGRFSDRPGTVQTTVADPPRVTGNALTVMDAELKLPTEDEDDGIIEV